MRRTCSFWDRHCAREQKWDGVEVSAEELVRIRDAQVVEDKEDPPCRECDACLLLLDEEVIPFSDIGTDFSAGDTLDNIPRGGDDDE